MTTIPLKQICATYSFGIPSYSNAALSAHSLLECIVELLAKCLHAQGNIFSHNLDVYTLSSVLVGCKSGLFSATLRDWCDYYCTISRFTIFSVTRKSERLRLSLGNLVVFQPEGICYRFA